MYQQIIITLIKGSTPDRIQSDLEIYKAGLHGKVSDLLAKFYGGSQPQQPEYLWKDFKSGDFYLVAHKLFICHVGDHCIYLFEVSSDFERSAKH